MDQERFTKVAATSVALRVISELIMGGDVRNGPWEGRLGLLWDVGMSPGGRNLLQVDQGGQHGHNLREHKHQHTEDIEDRFLLLCQRGERGELVFWFFFLVPLSDCGVVDLR